MINSEIERSVCALGIIGKKLAYEICEEFKKENVEAEII